MERKPEAEQRQVPATQLRTYLEMARARGKLKTSDVAVLALRSAKDRLMSH